MINDYAGLLELAGEQYKQSAKAGAASAFAQMASGYMNYQALRTDAAALKAQANSIELQAQERANQLREQFISSIGSYKAGAAQRGIAVSSGSVMDNIESSAIGLDKDISKMKRSAGLQASAIRTQAKVAKYQAKSALVGGILEGIGSAASAFTNYSIGSQLTAKG